MFYSITNIVINVNSIIVKNLATSSSSKKERLSIRSEALADQHTIATMYSSYKPLKSRSKSTTDLFRATSPENNVGDVCSTLSRPSRRRQGPTPPRRTDSLLSVHEATSQKRVRSILAEDISWQFSGSPGKASPGQSPRSNNFVRRLVESLERRQREGTVESPVKRTGWGLGPKRHQDVGVRKALLEEEPVDVGRVTREQAFVR